MMTMGTAAGRQITLLAVIQGLYSFGDRGQNMQDGQSSLAEGFKYQDASLA